MRILLFFLLYSRWFPLPEPIVTPPPFSEKAAKEIPTFIKRHKEPRTADELYELALLRISVGDNQAAIIDLERAVLKKDRFVFALIQLGYLYLWENKYERAYSIFKQTLSIVPGDPKAQYGLQQVGSYWLKENEHLSECFTIFESLYSHEPSHADVVFFFGLVLMRQGDLSGAKEKFQECLDISPNYTDALYCLANIYKREEKWAKAEEYYQKAICCQPSDYLIRKDLAHALVAQQKLDDAKEQYILFLTEDPSDSKSWNELRFVKSNLKPNISFYGTYTSSEENDPDIEEPVVRDNYLYTKGGVSIPINPSWNLNIGSFYYQQEELNIYRGGTNYDVWQAGLTFLSNLSFANYWRWHAAARAFHASPTGSSMTFPFSGTTRFEPDIAFIYTKMPHLAAIDLHLESFFTKNFSIMRTELLNLLVMELDYLWRPDWNLRPELETIFRGVKFYDSIHNWQNMELLKLRTYLPYLPQFFQLNYQFQHAHFKKLSPNYFSYKQQFINKLGSLLSIPLRSSTKLEIHYEHSWQLTQNLLQPIGTFIFAAKSQLLNGNRITATLTETYKDLLTLTLEGHYFQNNLPYHDWNINGSLSWQF